MPAFKLMYGTAWKEDDTARCVRLALEAGFRAFDTANQRKHYHEAQVGEALSQCGLPRSELFVQTKFTFRAGQDQRLPYDPAAPIATQVEQSFQSSLQHLQVDFLDSYVLHGPSSRSGWTAADREAWGAMEALHQRGLVRSLGVSNVTVDQLQLLLSAAKVPPRTVQNRCYARWGWDADVRALCSRHGVVYQGFSLLTANPQAVARARPLGQRLGLTGEQVVFAFAVAVGMLPLTGTQDAEHMREDLRAVDVALSPGDVAALQGAAEADGAAS